MPRRKRRDDDNPILILLEIAGAYWPAGLVGAAVLTFLAVVSLSWAINLRESMLSSPFLASLANSLGAMVFGLPLLFCIGAACLAAKAAATYRQENRY